MLSYSAGGGVQYERSDVGAGTSGAVVIPGCSDAGGGVVMPGCDGAVMPGWVGAAIATPALTKAAPTIAANVTAATAPVDGDRWRPPDRGFLNCFMTSLQSCCFANT